ncbi:MAG: hypothetical protein KAT47_00725 [Candidatus Aegiribacteria sp.]|nr:hypothetical protein [Candidatus Aegiribacteria sp.]
MRTQSLLFIVALFLLAGCGGESESDMETTPDSVSAGDSNTQESEPLSTVETVLTTPQEAITGAYNLIDKASTVVDAANERTEELERMMEGI